MPARLALEGRSSLAQQMESELNFVILNVKALLKSVILLFGFIP
jgi:hypothetical protein